MTSFTITEPPALESVHIEAPGRDAPLCLIAPTVQGYCEELDTQSVQEQVRGGLDPSVTVLGIATVRYEDSGVMVIVTSVSSPSGTMTAEWLQGFMQGMTKVVDEMPGARVVDPPRRIRIRDQEAVTAAVEQPSGDVSVRARSTTLFSKARLHTFTFVGPVGDESITERVANHTLSTVAYEPGDLGKFGRPRAEVLGYHIGKLLIPAGFVVMIAILALHQRKSRKARAQYARKGSGP